MKYRIGATLMAVAAISSVAAFSVPPVRTAAPFSRTSSPPILRGFPFVGRAPTTTHLHLAPELEHLTSSLPASDLPSLLTSFVDQGQNAAGIFFQASLLPYLAFIYFIGFRGNRTPELASFAWSFLLLFVLSTIPGGIISKGTYGVSLADCDWLHGGAEALLTATNLLLVYGLRQASTEPERTDDTLKPKLVAGGIAAAFAVSAVLGPTLLSAHTPFLFGIGNLPDALVYSLPWAAAHSDPVNSLSIPTWAIHYSSVIEYVFAMSLVWRYAEVTGNERWKGLTWGMLPLHASGVCACTYHFFYNPSDLQFLVTLQAFTTLLGNITLAYAAYRIAISNGWTLGELNPLPKSQTDPRGLVVEVNAAKPLLTYAAEESEFSLAIKLAGATFLAAYVTKYGELGIDLPFTPNPVVASLMILTPPAIVGYNYYDKSKGGDGLTIPLPSFGGGDEDAPMLSMDDIKRYGAAGTLAYVLTELAFWAVAFPVASYALYNTSGHWPDVINDAGDRTTVLGFIFAGANVARLAVPLRLGAALALAPWVDENIINRGGKKEESE